MLTPAKISQQFNFLTPRRAWPSQGSRSALTTHPHPQPKPSISAPEVGSSAGAADQTAPICPKREPATSSPEPFPTCLSVQGPGVSPAPPGSGPLDGIHPLLTPACNGDPRRSSSSAQTRDLCRSARSVFLATLSGTSRMEPILQMKKLRLGSKVIKRTGFGVRKTRFLAPLLPLTGRVPLLSLSCSINQNDNDECRQDTAQVSFQNCQHAGIIRCLCSFPTLWFNSGVRKLGPRSHATGPWPGL